jgi:hypothetical protein
MSPRRPAALVLAAAALAVLGPVLAAPPAAAHTVSSARPTNYRSEIVSIDPPTPGVTVRLLDLGRKVELTNRGSLPVVVLGYQGEPYLRVGPDGVFENGRSPAVYLNRSTAGPTTTAPPSADAAAAPDWHKVGDGRTATWRDRRTRWEGPDPPSVLRAPTTAQVVVPTWHLSLRQGGSDVVVTGRISWIPPSRPWPWVAVAAALAGVTVLLGRARRWGPALAGALATLLAVTIVRSVGLDAASGGSPAAVATRVVVTGVVPVLAWAAGLWAVGALQTGRENGVTAAGTVSAVLAVLGLTDAVTLARSQVQPAFTPTFSRLALAATLGLGVGLAAAAVLALRRSARAPAPPAPV